MDGAKQQITKFQQGNSILPMTIKKEVLKQATTEINPSSVRRSLITFELTEAAGELPPRRYCGK